MPRRYESLMYALIPVLVLAGCRREDRTFRPVVPVHRDRPWTSLGDLQPGPEGPSIARDGQRRRARRETSMRRTPTRIARGPRLFSAYNCVGCHGHGGGGMGPPLMDDSWIYGEQPQQIFATLVEGRPNGMPTFGREDSRLSVLVARRVRQEHERAGPPDAAPGRPDHMKSGVPPSSRSPAKPTSGSSPSRRRSPNDRRTIEPCDGRRSSAPGCSPLAVAPAGAIAARPGGPPGRPDRTPDGALSRDRRGRLRGRDGGHGLRPVPAEPAGETAVILVPARGPGAEAETAGHGFLAGTVAILFALMIADYATGGASMPWPTLTP